MKFLLLMIAVFCISAYAQFIPFAYWNKQDLDPCSGSPAIGTVCSNGTIYAGVFSSNKYYITPGDCTNSSTPTCDGTTDTLTKIWFGSGGSAADIPGVDNLVETSTSVTPGPSATASIAAHGSTTSSSSAHYCQNMNYGGKTDWYLPTKTEMAYIYCKNALGGHNSSYPQESPNCAAFGGRQYILPGFSSSLRYHTATEFSGTTARYIAQFMNSGDQDNSFKYQAHLVRCIRKD